MADHQYVSAEWAEETLRTLAGALHPQILAAHQKNLGGEEVQKYFNAIEEIDGTFVPNLAPLFMTVVNAVVAHVVNAYAVQQGERMTVTAYDSKGRISETVKLPIWARMPETEKQVDVGNGSASA